MTSVEKIQAEIAEIRAKLVAHPVYRQIRESEDLKIFMQHHVFAVWDFMSLLKSLQQELTCVKTPWVPVGSAATRFLINEIVIGEESDIDEAGNRISHFELYLQAMQQCGADTQAIEQLISSITAVNNIHEALEKANLSKAIKDFVSFTFKIIESGKPHLQAAVFTFGREDLNPEMFMEMVTDLH